MIPEPANATPDLPDPLPALRQELSLHEGPAAENGAPTWMLHDPVRHLYFRLEWLAFEILARWHSGNAAAIAASVAAETTLAASVDDVAAVCRFLQESELLELNGQAGTTWYAARVRQGQSGPWKWLLHHYLFFRIPLVRPDRWLERTQAWVAPFYTRQFLGATLLAMLVGMIEVARQWEHFVATLVDTFSLQGAIGVGLAMILAKTLHELGHAFTAKRMGCRVPVMGVAFLVLWPLAYTDVNDAWKLKQKKQRLAVGAAGIGVELALAAWATLAWALLPDGVLRGIAFLLATTTWIATLAINSSPFLRFDGYFLLSDTLGMPNLHARSFALARWRLRELLFGLGEDPPEYFTSTRRRGLILFAWAVWIYRLVVFLGIAVLVYHMFAKAVGLILGTVEVLWFILLPIWSELKVLRQKWPQIKATQRSRRSGMVAVALLVLVALPWSFQIHTQGVLKSAQVFPLIVPAAGALLKSPPPSGTVIRAGEPLMQVVSPDLETRMAVNRARSAAAAWAAQAAALDTELQPRLLVLRRQSETALATFEADLREMERLAPTAPFAGVMLDVPPDLSADDWVARHERLGVLIDPTHWRVEAYVDESSLNRIKVGNCALFLPETAGSKALWLKMEHIDHDATRVLADGMLASSRGGHIPVRERGNQVVPDRAIYRVIFSVNETWAQQSFSARGTLVIYGTPTTLMGEFLRSAIGMLVRESGF
jgi:putative peptide zinc metalloprotease protein